MVSVSCEASGYGMLLLQHRDKGYDRLPEGFSHGSPERCLWAKPNTFILLKLTKIKHRFRDSC